MLPLQQKQSSSLDDDQPLLRARSSIVSIESEVSNNLDVRKPEIKAEYKSEVQNITSGPLNIKTVLDIIQRYNLNYE